MKLIPCLVALSSMSFSVAAMADTAPAAGTEPMSTEATSTAADTTTTTESMTEPMAADANQAATDTAATAPAEETTEQAGFSRGSVVRSIFTTAVQEREPIDKLNNQPAEAEQVFYFTELRDMSGQTATHRWEHEGKVMAEVKFDVRGPRWRVWSSKSFVTGLAGDWKVSVINGAGETISEEMITMSSIPTGATEAAPTETPAAEPMATDATTPAATEPATQEFQPPVNDQLMQ